MLDSLNETAITGTKKNINTASASPKNCNANFPNRNKKNIKKLRTTPVCLRKTPTTERHKNTHNRTKPAPLN